MPRKISNPESQPSTLEVCILAGGLSRRMGRDKTRLQLGKRTMLGQIRAAAEATGWPVRVIRRDSVPRCGPIGGVHTALKSTRARAVLFLACDMPFVSGDLITWLTGEFVRTQKAVFVRAGAGRGLGFPFILPRDLLRAVSERITRGEFSLRGLAKAVRAKTARIPRGLASQLVNVNNPQDWLAVRQIWHSHFAGNARRP